MDANCPRFECQFFQKSDHVVKNGFFFRREDSRYIQRYRCLACRKFFSASTHKLEYRQKKRRVNFTIFKLLGKGNSMRGVAKITGLNKNTIAPKLIYLAKKARLIQQGILAKLEDDPVQHIQFDDLQTFEHTKMKPLTVPMAVAQKSRIILGVQVGGIPASGLLASKSRKKYGRRDNDHHIALMNLFESIRGVIGPKAIIDSDEHSVYPEFVREYFPNATHCRFKGSRGCVTGQGELKAKHFDPLFSINHTYAMLRANISRLIRRSWNTTKKPEMLQNHLDLYVAYHNLYLV